MNHFMASLDGNIGFVVLLLKHCSHDIVDLFHSAFTSGSEFYFVFMGKSGQSDMGLEDINKDEMVLKDLEVVDEVIETTFSSDNFMAEISLEDVDDGVHQQNEKPKVQRQNWDKPVEFLLACISMSVGLGNVWRFPYVAYKNGGGAFLIPYLCSLILVGKPLCFLEMCMGQFCSQGSAKLWHISPFFKGIGYSATLGSACVLSFYCALMAITVFYFFQSFNTVLPWTICNEDWNITCDNATGFYNNRNVSIPELYFNLDVYHAKDSIDDGIGAPDWRLSLCLLFSWILIFISLIKGVQSAGKVAYFTSIFPYITLVIFLIRGVTLPGAWEGISYFLYPQFDKILEPQTWLEATKQTFFSLSLSFGSVITFASYNKFSHDIYRDAMIVSILDLMTSMLAGITTFGVLGYLAYRSEKSVEDVVSGGPGLAFVSYPQAIASFPFLPQFFSVLFFLMLFTLGIGSATSMANSIITVIHDKFTSLDKRIVTVAVSVIGFCLGLIYVTPGGLWVLTLVDYFGAGSIILVLGILEMIGLIFVYGLPNIVRDIQFMLGRKISLYWQYSWVLTPFVLTIALIYDMVTGKPLKHDDKQFPPTALVFGWLLVGIAIVMLPAMAMHGISQQDSEDTFFNRLKQSFRPSDEWGPRNPSDRRRWQADKEIQARRPSLVGKFFISR